MERIPFVIIFNTNSNGDKINDDIYDSVTNENDLELKVFNIFKNLMIDYEFVVINRRTQKYELCYSVMSNLNKTKILYELFCQKINGKPHNTNDLFAITYFIDNEWFIFDNDDLIIIFNECYNQIIKS
jgi:hypothetical protein